MCTIVIVNFSLSMVGMLAETSRQLWSFSRDKGVPGGWWWWWWWSLSPLTTFFPWLYLQSI
ncbi:hypothetical protein N7533_010076 [Penicillium manginii]|uniref:uncharacterized protein n=1 Tax=Penicillium manginii TaxID=203109 RepID=UPI00254841A7|nr:uncharacterized protein N7533_010076 [Penicillium manginii]KAJ5742974.1 hypothetical protein N7533_010076 [Penicillium manginii]